MRLQKALLEVMYEIFRLSVPIVTGDFEEALHSVGKKHISSDQRRFTDCCRGVSVNSDSHVALSVWDVCFMLIFVSFRSQQVSGQLETI